MLEFVWKAKKIPRHERQHVFKLLLKELFRILKLGGGRTTDNILLLRQSSSIPNSLGGAAGLSLRGSAPAVDSARSAAKSTARNRRSLPLDERDLGELDQVFQTLVQQSRPLTSLRKGGMLSPGLTVTDPRQRQTLPATLSHDGRQIRRLPSNRLQPGQQTPHSTLPTDEEIVERLEAPPNVRYVRSMPASPATPLSPMGRQQPLMPATAQPVGLVRNPQINDFLNDYRRPRSLHPKDCAPNVVEQQSSHSSRNLLQPTGRQKSRHESDSRRSAPQSPDVGGSPHEPTIYQTAGSVGQPRTPDATRSTRRTAKRTDSTKEATGSGGKRSTSGGPHLRRSYLEQSPIIWPQTTGVEKKFDDRN